MFNTEEDYLDDIATLNSRIIALKAENEYLKREVKRLAEESKTAGAAPEDGQRLRGRDDAGGDVRPGPVG